MAIELPSGPAVLEHRLAALEDPVLAERLFRENPELFSPELTEPPRTQREVLRWATRRVGTAVIAITAAVSIVAGYFGSELTRHPAATVQHATPHAATAAPVAHARPAARHVAVKTAAHHAATVAAPVYVAPRVVHVAPVVQPHPDREAQLLRARLHARDLEVARLRVEAAHARAAARAAQARAHPQAVAASAPAPQSRPQSEPAAATGPERTGGVKNPPASPGGVWNERLPGGGTLGGMIPPILVGVPRDSCTPQGGRIGGVQRVIQAAQIIQSLSRQ